MNAKRNRMNLLKTSRHEREIMIAAFLVILLYNCTVLSRQMASTYDVVGRQVEYLKQFRNEKSVTYINLPRVSSVGLVIQR